MRAQGAGGRRQKADQLPFRPVAKQRDDFLHCSPAHYCPRGSVPDVVSSKTPKIRELVPNPFDAPRWTPLVTSRLPILSFAAVCPILRVSRSETGTSTRSTTLPTTAPGPGEPKSTTAPGMFP